MLLGLSLLSFIKHRHFVTFPAVFTQLLWLLFLNVSWDNEVNLMFGFWKRFSWKYPFGIVQLIGILLCNFSAKLCLFSSPFWALKYACLIKIRISLIPRTKDPGKVWLPQNEVSIWICLNSRARKQQITKIVTFILFMLPCLGQSLRNSR